MNKNMAKRVNVYIDGFNLYHVLLKNIKEGTKPWESDLKWCNLRSLVESYLQSDEELGKIYFFTADSWIPETRNRGIIYQKALNNEGIDIIKGKYSNISRTFVDKMKVILLKMGFDIGADGIEKYYPKRLMYKTYEEKRTDVNIAVKILEDAFLGNYDNAIIMSGDSDIVPAIESVKKNFTDKKFTALWLVGTKGQLIKNLCDNHEIIGYNKMKSHKFDTEITLKTGEKISMPNEWRA